MNVLLLVVDSLRHQSLRKREGDAPATPFLDRLGGETLHFDRAHATECWTLPSHTSMFTGLLPSEHGAHFQHLGYAGKDPTVAEILAEHGFHTELATRNPIFEGSLPGVTRGFQHRARLLRDGGPLSIPGLFLALSKPRFRRQIQSSGFFNALQRDSVAFLKDFAYCSFPADGLVLDHLRDRTVQLRQAGRPFFLFGNLYDVHAPYCPDPDGLLREMRSWEDVVENVVALGCLAKVGSHAYLQEGFRMTDGGRRALLARYHTAIELMDRKLESFFEDLRGSGALEDTLVIVTSDHGEAFGDHDLYLHDASVFDTNLRVPLWIHHPDRSPARIDDVVSQKDLFDLVRCVALDLPLDETILDEDHRARNRIVFAEHFHYPHVAHMQPRYRVNLVSAMSAETKIIVRGDDCELYERRRDPDELAPVSGRADELAHAFGLETIERAERALALEHLAWFEQRFAPRP